MSVNKRLHNLHKIKYRGSDRKDYSFSIPILSFLIFVFNLKYKIKSPQARMNTKKNGPVIYYDRPRCHYVAKKLHKYFLITSDKDSVYYAKNSLAGKQSMDVLF